MCGIVSFLGNEPTVALTAVGLMSHRGIIQTTMKAGPWTLGRTRLPIVGSTCVDPYDFDPPYRYKGWTFNFAGEIVNYKDFVPSARCDVEVLARMWVNEGPACLRRFDGFWSVIAIPPDGSHTIVAIDFLSKKPLYFRKDKLAFASEIKALAALGPLTPDPVYFSSVRKWGYHAGPRTWAKEVQKVPPGALWAVSTDGMITRTDDFDIVEPEASPSIVETLGRSVGRRVLSSDHPVAILLSGGLDSSIVYKLAKGLRSDMTIYHAPNIGDTLDALEVKEKVVEVPYQEFDLDSVLVANEGPVDLGSMLPQYALGQAVKERVALSGDGADELFGGYRRAAIYDSQGSDIYDELVHYHAPRLDKLMMAGTVELRSPFLGREVLAHALATPREWRIDKLLLRTGFSDLLPDQITNGPKVPLKSQQVKEAPELWRYRLCDKFQDMAQRGFAI